jgi:FlaG/FlaF family flagellin (archaellin)
MIINAKRFQGLVTNPGTKKTKDLIVRRGKGVFVAMQVSKQGGSNNITEVSLFIDGQNVVAMTYAACHNIGLNKANNSGTILCESTVNTMTVQYNEPLYFQKELRIAINTGSDAGVVQIVASAVIGTACSYPT